MGRFLTNIGTALLALGLSGGPVLPVAAQATPEATDPAACTIAPRPLADFRLLPAEPPATPATNSRLDATAARDAGEPAADPDVIEAVTATVRLQLACLNAGDLPRAAALFTDEAFLRSGLGPGADASDEVLESLLAPRPIPSDQHARLVAIEEVRQLPDGRVTAEVVGIPPGTDTEIRQRITFVEADGAYLIVAVAPVPAPGTPTP
jgi:hypothetical protein